MRIFWIDEVDSTNSYMESHLTEFRHGDVVAARSQTAGRGQRGNSWESTPGENLTFTMLLNPPLEANRQFALSSMVALEVCRMLDEMCGVKCKVKWPNDIYTSDDRKICGILISHSLQGHHIRHSVVGIGININQRIFQSDAPNPVSVFQLTGNTHDCSKLLENLSEGIFRGCERLADIKEREHLAKLYMSHLWRNDGKLHPFRDNATGRTFEAHVEEIEPTGHLLLRDSTNTLRRYAFKEVEWIL